MTIHRHNKIHRLFIGMPKLGAKDQFYCNVYYITLNSNCEAPGVSKKLKKAVEDSVRIQN